MQNHVWNIPQSWNINLSAVSNTIFSVSFFFAVAAHPGGRNVTMLQLKTGGANVFKDRRRDNLADWTDIFGTSYTNHTWNMDMWWEQLQHHWKHLIGLIPSSIVIFCCATTQHKLIWWHCLHIGSWWSASPWLCVTVTVSRATMSPIGLMQSPCHIKEPTRSVWWTGAIWSWER